MCKHHCQRKKLQLRLSVLPKPKLGMETSFFGQTWWLHANYHSKNLPDAKFYSSNTKTWSVFKFLWPILVIRSKMLEDKHSCYKCPHLWYQNLVYYVVLLAQIGNYKQNIRVKASASNESVAIQLSLPALGLCSFFLIKNINGRNWELNMANVVQDQVQVVKANHIQQNMQVDLHLY